MYIDLHFKFYKNTKWTIKLVYDEKKVLVETKLSVVLIQRRRSDQRAGGHIQQKGNFEVSLKNVFKMFSKENI